MKYADMDRPARAADATISRGAVSGLLLVVLGGGGALIPFVGPHFNFAYTPDQDWAWSTARGWLEVLPGAAAVVGGLLLVVSGNRVTAMLGGWLAVLAGVWFVVGVQVAPLLGSVRRRPDRGDRAQAGRARGFVFLRSGCADRLRGRGRVGPHGVAAGPRCATLGTPAARRPDAGSRAGDYGCSARGATGALTTRAPAAPRSSSPSHGVARRGRRHAAHGVPALGAITNQQQPPQQSRT